MKKYRSIIIAAVIFSLALVVILVASPAARAAVDAISLNWWTVDSGGGQSAGGIYRLQGIAGQPDAGFLEGGGFGLEGGFLGRVTTPPIYNLLLPMVIK
jgi:hypothetical protein